MVVRTRVQEYETVLPDLFHLESNERARSGVCRLDVHHSQTSLIFPTGRYIRATSPKPRDSKGRILKDYRFVYRVSRKSNGDLKHSLYRNFFRS